MDTKNPKGVCPSCNREYAKMPYRERMLNGNMGHLENGGEQGTILVDEGPGTARD